MTETAYTVTADAPRIAAELADPDYDEPDWPEVSRDLREMSVACVGRAFDWLDKAIAEESEDSATLIFVLLDLEGHDIAYALGSLLSAYSRAVK